MRDPFLNTILPFLANDLAARGRIEIIPCTCPPGGPCLGTEDEPVTLVFIEALNDDEDDNGSAPAAEPGDDEFDEDFDDEEDFEFELTPEGIAEIEREQDRQEVAHLGKIIDNMVYIVGMHAALVQNKVGA